MFLWNVLQFAFLLVYLNRINSESISHDPSYCQITRNHTMCKFGGTLHERCGDRIPMRGLTEADIRTIVDFHNSLRSKVAIGQEFRGKSGAQPPAANMLKMKWDPELAKIAQAHADQCIFAHDCGKCRKTGRFNVGQNLFITFSPYNEKREWARAIKSWYDEVKDFNQTHIRPFVFSSPLGHYTQMAWWNTRLVGCGLTMFKEDGFWKKLYTCNYGPTGNIINNEMYRVGKPCSMCPIGSSCTVDPPGLCDVDTTTLGPRSTFHTDQLFNLNFEDYDYSQRPPVEVPKPKTKLKIVNFVPTTNDFQTQIQQIIKKLGLKTNNGLPPNNITINLRQIDKNSGIETVSKVLLTPTGPVLLNDANKPTLLKMGDRQNTPSPILKMVPPVQFIQRPLPVERPPNDRVIMNFNELPSVQIFNRFPKFDNMSPTGTSPPIVHQILQNVLDGQLQQIQPLTRPPLLKGEQHSRVITYKNGRLVQVQRLTPAPLNIPGVNPIVRLHSQHMKIPFIPHPGQTQVPLRTVLQQKFPIATDVAFSIGNNPFKISFVHPKTSTSVKPLPLPSQNEGTRTEGPTLIRNTPHTNFDSIQTEEIPQIVISNEPHQVTVTQETNPENMDPFLNENSEIIDQEIISTTPVIADSDEHLLTLIEDSVTSKKTFEGPGSHNEEHVHTTIPNIGPIVHQNTATDQPSLLEPDFINGNRDNIQAFPDLITNDKASHIQETSTNQLDINEQEILHINEGELTSVFSPSSTGPLTSQIGGGSTNPNGPESVPTISNSIDGDITIPKAVMNMLPEQVQATIKRLMDLYEKSPDNFLQEQSGFRSLSSAVKSPAEVEGTQFQQAIPHNDPHPMLHVEHELASDARHTGLYNEFESTGKTKSENFKMDTEELITALEDGNKIPHSQVLKANSVSGLRTILDSVPEGIEPLVFYKHPNGNIVPIGPGTLSRLSN